MTGLLILNPLLRVTPSRGDAVRLEVAGSGFSLVATPYQVRLLTHFAVPSAVQAVLSDYPFEVSASRAFLHAAEQGGALVPADARGRACVPDTVLSSVPMMGAAPFSPAAPAALTFLGVPADLGTSGLPGARFGPQVVRQVSEAASFTLDPATLQSRGLYDQGQGRWLLQGVTVADAGDVSVHPGEDLHGTVGPRLTRAVRQIWDAGSLPLVVGGDHALTYYALMACQAPAFGVVHFDAHTDLGDAAPVLHHGNVFRHVLDRIEPVEHLWQVGLRGLSEGSPAEDARVTAFGMHTVRRGGFELVLAQIPQDLPIYVSVDIDVLDPAFAPSTGTPVAGGLFPHELKDMLHQLCSARPVLGVDVMEVAGSQGPADGTGAHALSALLSAADGIIAYVAKSLDDEQQ